MPAKRLPPFKDPGLDKVFSSRRAAPTLFEGEYTKAGMMKYRAEDDRPIASTWYKHKEKDVYRYQLHIAGGNYRDQGGDFNVFQPLGQTGGNYEGIKQISLGAMGKTAPKRAAAPKRRAAPKKRTATKRKAARYGIKVKGHMRSGYKVRGHLRHCKQQ